MADRIAGAPVRYPFSFVIAGDTGAWPDPTADAILAQLLRQTASLQPAPLFFANLGDFAGPGVPERHLRYLDLVAELPIPDVCLIGNHDLENPRGAESFGAVHGPRCFQFAHGHTRFVAIDGASGQTGGGGAALYLSYRLAAGTDRGAIFHAVAITVAESGTVSGRVFQAFAPPDTAPPFAFGDP